MVALALFLALLTPLTPAPSVAAQDASHALLEAMHARYAAQRAPTLTFVQETILHRPDGRVDTTTWYEAAAPGKLRIDFAPVEAGNGVLYMGGRRYTFQGGELVDERPEVNPLQVLLMDVFAQPVPRTAAALEGLGFDLSARYETTWQGRSVVVVGAASAADAQAPQFWVDAERLVVLRVLQPVGPEGAHLLDVHVTEHTEMDGVPHETALLIYVDDRLVQEEYYHDVRPGAPVDPALFDPADWSLDAPYWTP